MLASVGTEDYKSDTEKQCEGVVLEVSYELCGLFVISSTFAARSITHPSPQTASRLAVGHLCVRCL